MLSGVGWVVKGFMGLLRRLAIGMVLSLSGGLGVSHSRICGECNGSRAIHYQTRTDFLNGVSGRTFRCFEAI